MTVKMGHDDDCRKFGTKSLKMNCLSQMHFWSPPFQHSKHTLPIIPPSNPRGLAACAYRDSLPVSVSLLKAGPCPEQGGSSTAGLQWSPGLENIEGFVVSLSDQRVTL